MLHPILRYVPLHSDLFVVMIVCTDFIILTPLLMAEFSEKHYTNKLYNYYFYIIIIIIIIMHRDADAASL